AVCVLAVILAGLCFGVGTVSKTKKVVMAASTKIELVTNGGDKEEYSALFKGVPSKTNDDVIFSVEQVLLSNSYVEGGSGVKTFLGNEDNPKYNFKDITNGVKKKTVIDNGQFAVMKNELKDGVLNAPGKEGERQALMVSFGAYVYINEGAENVEIAKADNSVYSKVTYLDITLHKDGEQQALPDNRNIRIDTADEKGLFFDFVYVIEQTESNSNEGFYKFTIKYMIDSVEFLETFEFFVINELSYTNSINSEFGYNSKPILGWTEELTSFERKDEKEGYVRYKIGEDGYTSNSVSYPTITYDYTKYKLNYTHTANQRNIKYELNCEFNKTINTQTAKLNYTVTANGKVENYSIPLSDYNVESATNLVTILLTEPGTYTFDYEYIYDGYNSEIAPDVGENVEKIKLAIHGLDARYSKTDYAGANLQYYEIATKQTNNVDLFIPNGYNLDEELPKKGEDIGFAYRLIQSEEREGNIVSLDSENALINYGLKADLTDYAGKKAADYLVSLDLDTSTTVENFNSFKDNLNTILEFVSSNDL
ncbi:MAG: hypothetical protein IKY10_02115, partial [Clostridia bacterium]|nr:hypothetical protein [Clostridia bacterium]